MRILEKYVFKSFIISFIFCTVLLIVIGIVGDILGFLDDIFKNNIPLGSILLFYFYLAPFAFVNMVPFSGLLSAVYVFNSLSKNHEVTAVIASGLSLWKLLRPVLLIAFVLSLITFIVNDKFVPGTMQKANSIKQNDLEQDKNKKGSEVKDIAIYGKGDQIIFATSFSSSEKVLKNVTIHKQNEDHKIVEKISANTLKWEEKGGWVGFDVIIFKVGPDGKFLGDPEVYKSKDIFIEEIPRDFLINQWDPRFMSYEQLKKHIEIFKMGSPSAANRLRVDLNHKLAFPFTIMITILVGVPFSIETGRSANALVGMAKGITMATLYLPVMAISLALGKAGALTPVCAAWFSNILFAAFGIYMVNLKS